MDYERPVGYRAVEQLMSGIRIPREAELRPAKEHLVFRMAGCILPDLRDQQVRLIGGNAKLRGSEVEAPQREGAEPHMRVSVDDAGDDGLSAEIPHLCF